MLSRVADSLYWMSINMERADNIAKLLSVRLISILENNNPNVCHEDGWEEMIEITSNVDDFLAHHSNFKPDSVIRFITFQLQNPNSIRSCVRIARENAKMIREIIPIELWEIINDLYLKIKEFPDRDVTPEQLNDFFHMIREKSFLFQGIITGLMHRGEGYSFIMFGTYLERIRKLARTLDLFYHKERLEKEEVNYHYWSAVLSSVSGYESYLQKYQAFIDPLTVVNYLMFEDSLPRSAKFCAQKLLNAFHQLENNKLNSYSLKLNDKLNELQREVSYDSLEQVNVSIGNYFQNLQMLCNDVGEAITETYYLGEIKSI